MQNLRAKRSMKVDQKWVNPGDVFQADAALAERLVLRGLAEPLSGGGRNEPPVAVASSPSAPTLSGTAAALGSPVQEEDEIGDAEGEEDEPAEEKATTSLDELTSIPGVGKVMAQNLIALGFTSKEKLKGADKEELVRIKGMTRKLAEALTK